jgi:hypothetical protein
MADETDPTTDTAATDDANATTDATTTPTTPDLSDETAKWKALARKHEAESKKNATAAKRLAEIEEAGATELERAQKAATESATKLQAAEDRANRATIRAAVMAAATKAGAIDPDAVLQLLPADALTIDGDTVTGADEAVKALLAAKPYLAGKPAKPAGGSGDQGARGTAPLAVTRDQLKTMTAQQVAALNPTDIARAMSAP